MSPERRALLDSLMVERAQPVPASAWWSPQEVAEHLATLKAELADIWPEPRPVNAGPAHDEIAIQRALEGDRGVRLTKAEFTEAVARGTRRGMSAQQIADRLGVTDRTIVRRRTA